MPEMGSLDLPVMTAAKVGTLKRQIYDGVEDTFML
jgi:hypothetical protein